MWIIFYNSSTEEYKMNNFKKIKSFNKKNKRKFIKNLMNKKTKKDNEKFLPIFQNLSLQNLSLKDLKEKNNLEEDFFLNDFWTKENFQTKKKIQIK